ncbi:MAG: 1,4-dihydroxy-2-naphthoyl-CoA hydrolase [Cyanobacteria bacterium]|jgi:1,4-dihydroxy-2-naphthoyl-CoA hydrolase|nr:1,4-dihydroxy-2-naphthoyl-CoA hydrolase [Cyanobacteria bacterium GSL.Bin21]
MVSQETTQDGNQPRSPLTIPYRVRLADTDAAGVVYFAHLLQMCHTAYEEVLLHQGINLQDYLAQGTIALPIIHGEIDCLRPIFWGDLVWITLTPQFLSETELLIEYDLAAAVESKSILAKGKTQHVCIHPQTRNRLPFPSEIRNCLAG